MQALLLRVRFETPGAEVEKPGLPVSTKRQLLTRPPPRVLLPHPFMVLEAFTAQTTSQAIMVDMEASSIQPPRLHPPPQLPRWQPPCPQILWPPFSALRATPLVKAPPAAPLFQMPQARREPTPQVRPPLLVLPPPPPEPFPKEVPVFPGIILRLQASTPRPRQIFMDLLLFGQKDFLSCRTPLQVLWAKPVFLLSLRRRSTPSHPIRSPQ